MNSIEQAAKIGKINYKEITPKSYRRGIAWTWVICIFIAIVFGFLTYLSIMNVERVQDGAYDVLSTASILKIVLFPLGALISLMIASIIASKIRLERKRYIENYVALVKAERQKQLEKAKKESTPPPIVIPEMEEMEDDDNIESRRAFFEQNEFVDVVKMFKDYCYANKFMLTDSAIIEIFSALGCSRLVFVKGLDNASSKKIMELLVGFFLGTGFVDVINADGYTLKTSIQFFDWLKSCKRQGRLHFAGIECANLDYFAVKYEDFIPSIVSPEGICDFERFEKYGCDEKFSFPQSVWCLVNIENNAIIPKQLAKVGVVLDLSKAFMADSVTADGAPVNIAGLEIIPREEVPTSYSRFNEMISEELSRFSLSLENWKKLDFIEQFVGKASESYFDNKINRQIERYVAFEMSSGLEEARALDKVLAYKILPYMVAIPKQSWAEGEERVSEFLDRIFGLSHLPSCEIYLTEVATASELIEAKKAEEQQANSQDSEQEQEIQQEIQDAEQVQTIDQQASESSDADLKENLDKIDD